MTNKHQNLVTGQEVLGVSVWLSTYRESFMLTYTKTSGALEDRKCRLTPKWHLYLVSI
jgi:hypothetical protein